MPKLRIRTKIIAGYCLFVVLILTFLGVNGWLLSSTVGEVERVYAKSEEIRLELEARNLFAKQTIAMIDFFLFGEDEYIKEFEEHSEAFESRLNSLESMIEKGSKQQQTLKALRSNHGLFVAAFNKSVGLHHLGEKAKAAKLEAEEVNLAKLSVQETLDTLVKLEEHERETSMANINAAKSFVALSPFLSTTITNAEVLYRESIALERSLDAESAFWQQVVALTSFFVSDSKLYGKQFHEHGELFQATLKKEEVFLQDGEEANLLKAIGVAHQDFADTFARAEKAFQDGHEAAALKMETDEVDPAEEVLEKLLEQYYPLKQQRMDRALAAVKLLDAEALSVARQFGSYVVVLLVIGLGLGIAIAFRITKPIAKLAESLKRVAAGDFETRSEENRSDEIGDLATSFNLMAEALQVTTVSRTALQDELVVRERVERELATARDAALESARVKSEFLANMSHEIRTPMNGIIGMTELTLDTELLPEQRDSLEMVRESADSLLGIINDILDFSKIEAGRFELDPQSFDLPEMVGDILRPLALRADQKGLELIYQVAPTVPTRVIGDSARIRQILLNLVGNAIKFTESGEISVLIEKESETDTEVSLLFHISDTGIGVLPEKQKLIFEAFAQADGSTTRKYGGTGLGLTITSQLVNLMKGRLWVESPAPIVAPDSQFAGPGSIFHFALRLGAAPNENREALPTLAELRDLRVLIVDDNLTNRRCLTETLRSWQLKPHAVDGGRAALVELERAAAEHDPYQLVVLDAHMPDWDGFRVAESIRNTPELAGVTLMMLSSADQGNQLARCRELGLSLYLIKPVRQAELLAAIKKAFSRKPLEKVAIPPLSDVTKTKRHLKILLAEDQYINQRLVVNLMERQGHTVEVAGNGRVALELLAKNTFDLVLMDVQMPEVNGLEATAVIRRQEGVTGQHVPIIALTAHAMKGDQERCLAAGVDAYLSKPLNAGELVNTIELLISGQNGAATYVETGGPEMEGEVDFAALVSRTDGDVDLAHELIEIFLEDSPKLLSDVRVAVENGDAFGLDRAAHAAKGALGYFSSGPAVNAARHLQRMGAEGELSEAHKTLAELEQALEQLMPKLRASGRACSL